MAKFDHVQGNFSGGLADSAFTGRIDLDKHATCSQLLENVVPLVQGPLHFREGFGWVDSLVAGKKRLLPFIVDDNRRFLIVLFEYYIKIFDPRTHVLLYTRGDGTTSSVVPYKDEEILDVRWNFEARELYFTHGKHTPRVLVANVDYIPDDLLSSDAFNMLASDLTLKAVNTPGGVTPWDFGEVSFTSHPYKEVDTTGNVLRIDLPKETVRLESTNATEFNYSAGELSAMVGAAGAEYVEYKVNNQWGLGRVLAVAANELGISAPVDPSGTVAYVDPVDSVVNIGDPSARTVMLIEDATNAPWIERDGVPTGDKHVRCDTQVFATANIGAWIRVGGDTLFTNVARATADAVYNSQDGLIRWGLITDYRGIEDHPIDFLDATLDETKFKAGEIYEVFEWPAAGLTGINIYDGTGYTISDRSAYAGKTDATWRFAANIDILTGGSAGAVGLVGISDPYTGLLIANLSTQRQFDVVEVNNAAATSISSVKVSGTRFRSLTGDITLFDVTNDATGQATHTTTLYASRDTFNTETPSYDIGRYVMGELIKEWVTLKITGVTNEKTALVTVLSSVPRDPLTDDIKNNGVFSNFQLGAWSVGDFPQTVSFYEQRRIYGGCFTSPNLVWQSKINDTLDFRNVEDDGLVLDTTGITYPLGTASTTIRSMTAGATLVIGTESGEWQLRPNEFSAAITPKNTRITEETNIGSILPMQRVGSSVFFSHAGNRNFIEFKFDLQQQQWVADIVTKLTPFIFDDDPIAGFVYQAHPFATWWVWTEAGALFSLTYRKQDDFYAWAKHPINGKIESMCVVSKGHSDTHEDQVWAAIQNGTEYSLEVLAPSFKDDGTDNLKKNLVFLDSYVRFPKTGYAAQTSIPAASRFGTTVATVVDGVYLGELPVVNGLVILPESTTVDYYALIGFRYDGIYQPLLQSFPVGTGPIFGRR